MPGIRHKDKAAGLEAGFIVSSSFQSSADGRGRGSFFGLVLYQKYLQLWAQEFYKVQRFFFTVHPKQLVEFLYFQTNFFLGGGSICHAASVGMVVYLRKSIHSLLSVFKKKGECCFLTGFSYGDESLCSWRGSKSQFDSFYGTKKPPSRTPSMHRKNKKLPSIWGSL